MWKKPYKKGDRPVELDGRKHNCPKYKPREYDDTLEKRYTKEDYEKCPLCPVGAFGWLFIHDNGAKNRHMKAIHPNGEKYNTEDELSFNKKRKG